MECDEMERRAGRREWQCTSSAAGWHASRSFFLSETIPETKRCQAALLKWNYREQQ